MPRGVNDTKAFHHQSFAAAVASPSSCPLSQLPGGGLILFGEATCLTKDYLSQPSAESLGGTSGGLFTLFTGAEPSRRRCLSFGFPEADPEIRI